MDSELTWEQEQDIAAYEQWQAEQAWEAYLQRKIREEELAWEAEQEQLAEVDAVNPPTVTFIPYMFQWHNSRLDPGFCMNSKLFTPTVGKYIWIRTMNGEYMRAEKLFWSGDNITVKGADGFIYEVDANIRDEADAYVVLA